MPMEPKQMMADGKKMMKEGQMMMEKGAHMMAGMPKKGMPKKK
jgi:hypothetical protein